MYQKLHKTIYYHVKQSTQTLHVEVQHFQRTKHNLYREFLLLFHVLYPTQASLLSSSPPFLMCFSLKVSSLMRHHSSPDIEPLSSRVSAHLHISESNLSFTVFSVTLVPPSKLELNVLLTVKAASHCSQA